jgi:dolichyl-phosphate beta-glucosyltransferase
MEDPPYLSVIIPSFRSAWILEKNLPVLLGYLRQQTYSWEVLVVDDGSNDEGATEAVCQNAGCRCLIQPINKGKGSAVRNGMKEANGDFRIFTDADIPYETETIGLMLKFLHDKEYDMVIGDRNMQDSSYFTEIPWIRRVSSAFFTYFVGTIVTTNFYDTQCGIKGFTAKTAEILFGRSQLNGFAFDVELIYIALKKKMEIRRIPVRLRNQEPSTVRVFRHGIGMFLDLFRIKINNIKGIYR